MRLRKILAFGVVFLLVVPVPLLVQGNSKKHTVRNPSATNTANDLHVWSKDGGANEINSARIIDGDFPKTSQDAIGDHHIDFPPGSGSCLPGHSVTIVVNGHHGFEIDSSKTGLTLNGTLLTEDTCKCGCALIGCHCNKLPEGGNSQKFDLGGGGSNHIFTVTNNQSISVVYTNVEVWLENDNSIGQVDSLATFDTPTGFLSSKVPSTIEIPAHSDTTFELEPYTSGYDLFIGDVYPTCNSGSISPVASGEVPSAESIPTLSAISLAALVLIAVALGVYMILRRRRGLSTA